MHLYSLFSPIAACVFALALSSCHDEEAHEAKHAPIAEHHQDSGFFSYRGRCEASGGQWDGGLLACSCEASTEVFSAQSGCTDIRLLMKRQDGACFLGGLLVTGPADIDPCDDLAAQNIAAALRGATIEGLHTFEDAAILRFRPLTEKSIEEDIQRADYSILGSLIATNHDPDADSMSDVAALIGACYGIVADLQTDGAAQACDFLSQAISHIRSRHADGIPFADKHVLPGEPAVEMAMAKFDSDHHGSIYKVVGVAGIPLIRNVVLRLGEELRIDALLSPSGNIMGGRIEEYYPSRHGSTLLTKDAVYFDESFAVIRTKGNDFGDVDGIYTALEKRLKYDGPYQPVATDGSRTTIKAVRAMLIEGAIDPRFEALFRRVRVNNDHLREWLTSDTHPSLFAVPGTNQVDGIIDLVTSDPDGDDMHGTQVASVLVAGLHSDSLSLFPLRMGGWLTDLDNARQLLADTIRVENPQVVNLSLSFAPVVDDCNSFFGPIFREFEDETLFVVAAGNDGVRDAGSVCPAQLSKAYANVVSVAGTDYSGRIHHLSNYGRDSVQIAAPYCQDVLFDPADPDALREACGTSFAAPAVANAVLHAVADRPELSPSVLKRLLMVACSHDGLDVECGGAVDIGKFYDLVEEW